MLEKRKPFKNKVAFISGGSRGIGLAVAEKFAKAGCNIVFTYLRSRSDAQEAEKHLAAHHTRVISIRANMGNPEHIHMIFDTIKKEFSHLDFLLHNAATGDLKSVLNLTDAEWQRTQDINVKSLLLCTQYAVPLMHNRQGKIVAISSHGSHKCLPSYCAVGVSKAAIESLCRYLAVELAAHGINVNVILPGTTDTRSLRHIPEYEEMIQQAKKKTPMGRIGKPEDIADIIKFLCSEESRWIVGQTIIADGGFSLIG